MIEFGFRRREKDGSWRRILPDGKQATIFVTGADASDQEAVAAVVNNRLGGKAPNIVLADVPCPGDGRILTNPSSAVRRQPKTSADVGLQTAILNTAVGNVRPAPGGVVVYSTCSVNPIINEAVVAEMVGRTSRLSTVELPTDDQNLWPEQGDCRGLRTFPQALREGFFCAALVKD